MKSVKKNFVYNIVYQILVLIIPLITAPYLSRTVGAEGVGIYSYTYSIVYYFMLMCVLGLNNYGNRCIAKVRDDENNLSKTFWSIYLFQFFMGTIMMILYAIYLLAFDNKYINIAIIQSLFIISAIFDINWFFFGLEEFKITVTRNTVVKVLSLVLIFIFVKDSHDLWKYVLIMSGTTLISQLLIWPFLKNKIGFYKVSFKNIIEHIKPNFVLFVPVIAVSIYKIMDKIMLGFISNVKEVGFYENAEKIVHIPVVIIASLGTVMLPRISNLISNKKNEEIKIYIEKSIKLVMFMSFAMTFGLITIGYNFAPFYFGKEFVKTGYLIMALACTLPFLSFANVIRTQYLIPYEKDKIYIKSVILGAIVNLIMNIIFIPVFQSLGACIGTICAEIIVMLYQTISVKNELDIKKYMHMILPFFIKSVIMLIVIYPINFIYIKKIYIMLLQIIIGVLVYVLLNLRYFKESININKFYKKLRKKVK